MPAQNELHSPDCKRLGRLPAKSSTRALQFSDFFDKFLQLPERTAFWSKRAPIPSRTYGNNSYGNCTRAKQAVAATRMERLEQRRTIEITDDEIIRVYKEMSDRRYGGGDNGAYETDALDDWRNPETTFRDTDGRPYTIDAYLRINPFNHQEVKAGIALSGAHGIAVCLNLPWAFQRIEPPAVWDIPEGQTLVGEWMPGSWGGHSMWCHEYDAIGPTLDHTWGFPPQKITWRAAAVYLDEAHLIIDSVNEWKKRTGLTIELDQVRAAVNDVSSLKIA